MRTTDAIVIEELSYSYRGLEVFKNFSLSAESKTVVLRGASGCGKTTLLKLLSGNIKPDNVRIMPPTAGSCLVLQEDSLFPWLTGIENISKLTRQLPRQFQNHEMFGLIADFVRQKACRMSYGQRRMVELFRAIIFRPRFLYLDEPFNFLDEGNIGLIAPFLQGDFMSDTTLVLSNHHHDDGGLLKSATIYRFNGRFPVHTLERVD